MECTVTDCKAGPRDGKWKTPELPVTAALALLDRHRQDHHSISSDVVRGGGGSSEGVSRGRLAKLDRPKISENCSQQDFEFFKTEWQAYHDSNGEQPEKIMKEQLLQCAEESLRKTIRYSVGLRMQDITLASLMEEVKIAAVERQSDMLNEVRLMEAKQERGEPVRKFLARLRGLADICQIKVTCACGETPSYADKIIHTTLVKGLVDNETKGEILSKVDKLTLEQTVAFVEARETGQRSLAGLGGPTLAGQQVHAVRDYSESKCWRCGETGHTPRFKGCKAIKSTCKKCNKVGHFARCCKEETERVKTNANRINMFGMKLYSRKMSKGIESVKLKNEVFFKSTKKFEPKAAKPSPMVQITIRVDVEAYFNHQPQLNCKLQPCFLDKFRRRGSPIMPYMIKAITDTGAQANVMGDKHLKEIGMDTTCLYPTSVTMDCPNDMKLDAIGVFFAYIRAKSPITNDTLLHRGMVYVVKGDILLLSETALIDLGIIPENFPQVGQFGGYKQPDDGIVSFDSAKHNNITFLPEESHQPLTLAEIATKKRDPCDFSDNQTSLPSEGEDKQTVDDKKQVPRVVTSIDTMVKQPEGECDPESTLPCRCPRRRFADPPETLPMPATASNITALENWIKNYFKDSAFNQCRRQPWPMTTGKPMKIHTKPDTKPFCCKRPSTIPLHFRDQVRADIESDIKKGILERVPAGRPDTWCARLVIQPKKNGKARRTVDLSYLSKHGLEESHHTRSAPMVAKSVPANKFKSTLDCVDGYHGIVLAEEDRHKTTFATEFGMFQYTRAPQGYLSSGDNYSRYTDSILEDCPTTTEHRDWEKIVDDIITWSETIEEAFYRICSLLSHCNKNGLVFSPRKFRFARREVEFAGFLITDTGIKPATRYTESIQNFPTPKNISEVRSWYGLINQVAYCFSKTETMAPFRHLLSPGTEFLWTDELEQSFIASKKKIMELIQEGVYSFDPKMVTCLSTDYSKEGFGWMLQQKICQCEPISPTCCTEGWRLVLAGGAFCSKAEKNYSPIEGEAAAIVKGLRDTKYYTLGCQHLYIATDHKPLVGIFGDKNLVDIENKRLAKFKEKTMWWRFKIIYNPGKSQTAADALSRTKPLHPLYIAMDTTNDEQEILELNLTAFHGIPVDKQEDQELLSWARVYEATQKDKTLVRVIDEVERGMPDSSYQLEKDLRPFHQFRHSLHVVDGVLCYKDRLVIPETLRHTVLASIHAAHQGVTGMASRIDETVFWPGIHTDIIRTKNSCKTCLREAPSQPAGFPTAPPSPEYPFQMIVADYFSLQGHNFLVVACRFTGWQQVFPAPPGQFDSKSFINMMRQFFACWNIPEHLTTDGGPQMMSADVQAWLRKLDVHHQTSSSYFPHANTRAEVAVKSTKRMLLDNLTRNGGLDTDRFLRAILQYRNTPHQDCKKSPAQMVFGRMLRDFTPAMPYKYSPSADWCINQELRERLLAKSREQDGERLARNTRQLEELPIGTPVVIQNQTGQYPTKWDKTGVIVEIKPHNQLIIKVDGSRRLTLRNRRFVKRLDIGTSFPQLSVGVPPSPPPQPHRHDSPPQPMPPSASTHQKSGQPKPSPPDNLPPPPASEPRIIAEDLVQPVDEVTGVVGGETGGAEEAPDARGMGHGMDGDVGTNSHSPEEVPEQENEAATSYTDRPSRIRKPNVKYSATEYDLCSIRMKSKKHKMKPM